MKYGVKTICVLCALAACAALPAMAEADMPVVVDVAYTQEEIAAAEALEAEKLAEAQRMLIGIGYLTGAADGVKGPMTTAALMDFQTARGLEPTGDLDDATYAALSDMSETVADAKHLQERMVELGYMRGKIDGIFGERSQAALKLFQSFNGLEATGEADEATRAALFSESTEALPARLSGGDKGERVTALQQKLIQYGFMSGEADGSYGPKTAAAVKRFQKHLQQQGYDESLGITVNGEATSATQALLFRENYSTYIADLQPGDESDEVSRVENRLAELGYMDLQADNTFDDYAVRSARAFQADAGLGEGAFDRAFIDALFATDAPVAAHFVLHDIAYGDKGVAVREVEEALARGGMMIEMPSGKYNDALQSAVGKLRAYLTDAGRSEAALFESDDVVTIEAQQALADGLLGYVSDAMYGHDNAESLRVQRRLYTLYYLAKENVDGKFGNATLDAVKRFQETNGLTATGDADAATQKLMFTTDALPEQRQYRVEVDIDHQRVYVFERVEDGVYEQVKTFVCSTGLGNSTPRGIYLDGYPINYWHHFEKFNCWAKYSFMIEGSILFHSVLYSERDERTLREGSLYGLGQKASHGCVRLKVSDAKWLFEHCKRGTVVIVIY